MVLLCQPAPAAPARTLLVFGDSLSAGYGLASPGQGWVALLGKRLAGEGYEYRVVNASVSGETTRGGLERLPRALALHHPAIVVMELGANDGLRGLPVAQTRSNLTRMTQLAKQAGAQVLLVGMKLPPNYGARYTTGFMELFAAVARRESTAFVPFLLERVALDANLIQADGLHPNARAQAPILDTVWPHLKPLLQKR